MTKSFEVCDKVPTKWNVEVRRRRRIYRSKFWTRFRRPVLGEKRTHAIPILFKGVLTLLRKYHTKSFNSLANIRLPVCPFILHLSPAGLIPFINITRLFGVTLTSFCILEKLFQITSKLHRVKLTQTWIYE